MYPLSRFLLAWLLAASMIGALTCAGAVGAPDALARIKTAGVIRIGVKSTVPGIAYANPANGKALEGFEIDIARGIAKSILGDPAKIRFVSISDPDRIGWLQNGKVDLVLATMTITPERLQQIAFSNVYFKAGQDLLVRSGSPIASYRDLAGKTVCTERGSTSDVTLRRAAPAARVVLEATYGECYAALKTGVVDAMSTDNVILLGFWLRDEKGFKLLPDTFTAEPYGIGIAKGSEALRLAVNHALHEFRRSGQYDASYEHWLQQPLPRNYGFWIGMSPERAANLYAQDATSR